MALRVDVQPAVPVAAVGAAEVDQVAIEDPPVGLVEVDPALTTARVASVS